MSTAIAATAEREITTSGVTNALHTLIVLVGGSPPPRTETEEPAATENAEPRDAEHGKRAASARAENQRGLKRQRGPQAAAAVRNPSVQDLLKHKWGAASRGAAQPAQPGLSSRSIPPGEAPPKPPGPNRATATMTATVGKGKGKAEDGEGPATAGSLAARREVQPASAAATEGKQTAVAPTHATARHQGRSAIASVGPSAAAVEVKTEKRSRGGKKLSPTPVYTIDEDDADDEVQTLVSRWVLEAGDGGEQGGEAEVEVHSGGESADEQDGDPVVVPGGATGGQGDTSSKRRGCGIRAPPRGGPGLVSEPHLGGKKLWLEHGDRQDLQYKTAIAMLPYDKKVDPGLNLSQKQLRDWTADLSIAEGLHTGLLITMHYRNLVASKDRWQRMFESYRGLTKPGMHTTNEIAWAAVVGKEAAAEEAELGDVEPTDYAGAVACAIAMVWEVTRGSNVTAAADNGHLAARAAGCYGEPSRLFPIVSAYVVNAVRKRNARELQAEDDEPQVVADPKVVATAIVTGVVNEVVAKSRDLRHIELAARETVDVIVTWSRSTLFFFTAIPSDAPDMPTAPDTRCVIHTKPVPIRDRDLVVRTSPTVSSRTYPSPRGPTPRLPFTRVPSRTGPPPRGPTPHVPSTRVPSRTGPSPLVPYRTGPSPHVPSCAGPSPRIHRVRLWLHTSTGGADVDVRVPWQQRVHVPYRRQLARAIAFIPASPVTARPITSAPAIIDRPSGRACVSTPASDGPIRSGGPVGGISA
ncbi:unnamed protein product [Closterium sp. NIES-65]|nr:unnamed protein product [Closterium sp. NIES-65]